ncbi:MULTISPECIES: AraC family transcriptional regulator [Colwellia]|uniref:Transcriptional regulator, araC family n=1 Tax=Colwellia psychrerythraea (strain 34H / ATCC BAA-681) TaxID=167879 RepID=Q47ZJ7_COLP3|nr:MULTISPECIES: AraC family transcriptional regulator [Colwellia]AAZ28339.1 transcriptional regulator, araC family [Colwellia psychrerythraea 34H]PKH87212.1 AraC family transcriptional regulator [Colwellia sp. Bg11-28]
MLKNVAHQLKCPTSEFNVLDDVIDTLRFRGSIFFHSSLAAPWGMSLSSIEMPRFHIALEGDFYVGAGSSNINVNPMDIVMIPGGDMHWIADEIESERVPCEQAGDACALGMPLFQQGEITNKIMCGIVEYDEAIEHPILSALPSIIQLSNIQSNDNIWMTVKLIDAEIIRTNNKKNSIIDRLTEVLFIQLLNSFIEKNEHLTGFLSALKEPRLNKILQLIHQHPERQWTLDIISDVVGMSRATLQRKFKAAIGVSPMVYISRWRMAKAYQLLKHSNLSLEGIADVIGFSDARTLSHAFKDHYGDTPSQFRKKLEKLI